MIEKTIDMFESFVKLTDSDGLPIYVDVGSKHPIKRILTDEDGDTVITFDTEDYIYVAEKPEEVMQKVNAKMQELYKKVKAETEAAIADNEAKEAKKRQELEKHYENLRNSAKSE